MAIDAELVKQNFPQIVPMASTLNLEFGELNSTTAIATMPDQKPFHNHVGGPHAGAMFTLAESATGVLIFHNFGDVFDKATPLAVESTIKYLKLAMGPVTATATMGTPVEQVLQELEDGKRPEFDINVSIADEQGVETGQMVILWTLKPNRKN